MRIAHHLMAPAPPRPELDAAVRDAMLLCDRFGGEIDHLYPAARHHRLLPPFLCGLRQLRHLRELDGTVDAHQVYSNGLFAYPALARLERPIVYTLTTPLRTARPRRGLVDGPRVFVTPVRRDAELLRARGARRVEVIPPGIELGRFAGRRPPPDSGFVLLAGSAPWTERQLATKGFHLLLDAAGRRPELRLVLLWRGVLGEQIRAAVAARRLEERVEVLDRRVAVEEVLDRVHAAVVLASTPKLVKAYPHSLLEALAAGRPVLVSAGLELARLVGETGCGEVVPALEPEAFLPALDRLVEGYEERRRAAAGLDLGEFSVERFLERFGTIYRELAGR